MTRGANPETAIVNEICYALGMFQSQAKIKVYHMYVGGVWNQAANCYQKTGPFHPRGLADIMVLCDNGRVIWLEVKTATGRQNPDQVEFQIIVESLGFVYAVVRSAAEARDVLRKEGVL